MITERRICKRYPVSGRILFQAESMESTGELVDIGKWGAHIRSEAKPLPVMMLTARLEAQDYPGEFEVRGVVVRILSESWAMVFLEKPAGLAKLLRWLDKRAKK